MLKQTTWERARKTVESVCLDIIVKWRGDEENGRDQLDTILREVVVISDSEDDDEETGEDSDVPVVISPPAANLVAAHRATRVLERPEAGIAALTISGAGNKTRPTPTSRHVTPKVLTTPNRTKGNARLSKRDRKAAKKEQRGFHRYQAAWEQAMERRRHEDDVEHQPQGTPMARTSSNGLFPARGLDFSPMASPSHVHPAQANPEVIFPSPARRAGGPHVAQPVFGGHPTAPELDYSQGPRLSRTVHLNEARRSPTQVMTRSLTNPSSRSQQPTEPFYSDIIIRSIEAPAPVSMAPRFIRAIPARKRAREQSPDDDRPGMYSNPQTYYPPVDQAQEHPVKRRRITGDYGEERLASLGVTHLNHWNGQPHYPAELNYHVTRPEYHHSTYADVDPKPSLREHLPSRQMYREVQPTHIEFRDPTVASRHSISSSRHDGETVNVREVVVGAPRYVNLRGPIAQTPHPVQQPFGANGGPGRPSILQPAAPPRYADASYGPSQGDIRQGPMQPIFVRRVERRSPEPRYGEATRELLDHGGFPSRRQHVESGPYFSQHMEPYVPKKVLCGLPILTSLDRPYGDPHDHPYQHLYPPSSQHSDLTRNRGQPRELVPASSHPQHLTRRSYPYHDQPIRPKDIIVLD